MTISGQDLGASIHDLTHRVLVAGLPCKVIDYEVSVKLVDVSFVYKSANIS